MDGTGTVATEDRFKDVPKENSSEVATEGAAAAAVPINENLFLEDDLDGLDKELDDIDLDE